LLLQNNKSGIPKPSQKDNKSITACFVWFYLPILLGGAKCWWKLCGASSPRRFILSPPGDTEKSQTFSLILRSPETSQSNGFL